MSCFLELPWCQLSRHPVQDLRHPATCEPELPGNGHAGHPRQLEPDDLKVTGKAVIVAESLVFLGHRAS